MNKLRRRFAWLNVLCAVALAGCSPTQPFFLHEDGDLSHFLNEATEINYPIMDQTMLPDATGTQKPFNIENVDIKERWKLTLEEALSIAMQNVHVMRSLGGRVAQPVGQSAGSPPESLTFNPDFSSTAYDVAVQETSNTGVEAALANFDAQLQTRMTWDRSDRPANTLQNVSQFFQQTVERDQMNYQTELSKRAASGSQLFARSVTTYTSDNNPTRQHFSDWLTSFEFEVRHPLLRGSGVQVNRVPVMLARMNTDIAISDFEINVRDFVYEVEQAYWNLYYYYHNLDAARTGFDSAHATWKQTNTLAETGKERGVAANEAQSRAQYFAFKARLEQAKSDLLRQESRLRYLLGIAATDGRLIQPIDQPTRARVEFDWNSIREESLIRSPELRRQRWRIKQNELQVIAARNQLLPQLDAVALYRFLGIGDDLMRLGSRSGRNFLEDDSFALDNLTENDFGEWQIGFTFQKAIGYRAEMTQVRNTQLQLRRSEKRLEDLELTITHQLSSAYARLRDRYRIAQTFFNTLKAYRDQVEAAKVSYEEGQLGLDVVLDAQSRQAQAEIDYFRSLIEYNLLITEVHHRKGSLLEHNGIALAEGPWPQKAYQDSHERARQRDASYYLDYGFTRPGVVSQGSVAPYSSSPAITPASDSALPVGTQLFETPITPPVDGSTGVLETPILAEPQLAPPMSAGEIGNGGNGNGNVITAPIDTSSLDSVLPAAPTPSSTPIMPEGASSVAPSDSEYGTLGLD